MSYIKQVYDHAAGDCDDRECQQCCPHDEYDHYICIDCGYEKDPGFDIDMAEYTVDPNR